jgi:Cu-Zn family superoxide dismutase
MVWRFEPGAEPGAQHYLNGIVPADGGACVEVAAQGTGVLWRVATDGSAAEPIDLRGTVVNGDGLLWIGDVLYVCDNTEEPDGSERMWLTALRLSADARSGELLGRWERSRPDTPTTAALLGGRILVVNSQFGRERAEGRGTLPYTVSALTPPMR